MSSTVTCGYSGAAWSESGGKDACQMYAEVVGECSSSFTVAPVTPSSTPYQPASNECACNVVAYNLMAGCAWCQTAIQTDWWLTEDQWIAACGSTTYNPTTLPTEALSLAADLPLWAFAPVIGDTWNPSLASSIAVGAVTSTADSPTPNTRSTGLGIVNTDTSTRFNFPTTTGRYTGYPYDYNYDTIAKASVSAVAIGIGLVFGLWALVFIISGVAYLIRQKRRKAWYGPMAKYYSAGGAGGGGGLPYAGGAPHPGTPYNAPYQPPYGHHQGYSVPYDGASQRPMSTATSAPGMGASVGAPLLMHNEPNTTGSPHMAHSSLPPSNYGPTPSPGPTGNPYGGVDMHYGPPHNGPPGTNPFNTPYATPGQEPQQLYGGPSGPGNTNSYYGGPPPPGAAGASGYKGHAEVY